MTDQGKRTDERDPTTGIVLDEDANNKPVGTIARTYVSDDGSVHYAGTNPDGSPMSPTADAEGFGKLTPEQQRAAMTDFRAKVTAWQETHAPKVPDYLSPEALSQLDPAGQLAAIDKFLTDGAPDETPKVEIDDEGVIRYPEFDADGNVTQPWKLEGWKDLTKEQQDAAMAHYADLLERQATDAADPNAPVDPTTLEGLSTEEQIRRIRGEPEPTINTDGSITTPDPTGGEKATVTKLNGKIVGRTLEDGTKITYGDNGAQTTTSPDGLITETDNQGNTTYRAEPGTPAETEINEKAAAGYTPDGKRMSSEQAWYESNAKDPKHPTAAERDAYEAQMKTVAKTGWSAGEAVARAAVRAGLLPQSVYNQLMDADFAHSFGAWAAQNLDIVAAITNSNLDILSDRAQPGLRQTAGSQDAFDPNQDAYFGSLRGNQDYIPSNTLSQTDFTNGVELFDPRTIYGEHAAEVERENFLESLRQGNVPGVYSDPSPIPAPLLDPNWQPTYG